MYSPIETIKFKIMNHTMTTTGSSKPSLSPRHPPPFTPIQECEKELEHDDDVATNHPPTPAKRRSETVSHTKCRPCSTREKITIVPLDSTKITIKSIITSLKTTLKSPATSPAAPPPSTAEDRWRAEAADLSRRLISASKKRDEAVLEASRMKHSISELENKVDKLESFLKKSLENNNNNINNSRVIIISPEDRIVECFLSSVSEARTSLRILGRALAQQLGQMGPKVHDRVSVLLKPYDLKTSISKNPRAIVFYLEAFLNRAFFEDFESVGFAKSATSPTLNPISRCEINFKLFEKLKGLSWEEVLSKGTKHFSEEFSKFCDRKMSEVVTMLGWNRVWPEPLLQAFFNGSKSVWLVHLLANSVHPSLPIFRVEKGVDFDPVYMEDTSEAKAQKLVPSQVRIMVAPGFYVGNNVIKCKVLCRYHSGFNDKGLTPSSPV